MFYFLCALIGFILILLEEYFLGAYIDFTLTSLCMGYIIPIGCIIIGFVMGFFLHYGMLKGRLKYGKVLLLVTIIIGFLLFPAIQYMEYKTTYYEYDSSTDTFLHNRKFKGYSMKELGINFIDYEKQSLDNQNLVITGKGSRTSELPTAGILNYILYLINWVSMAFTCILVFHITAKDKKYCENCKKYYEEVEMFKFPPNDYDRIVEELPENINRIKQYATEHNTDVKNYMDYYEVYHVYCPKCNTGELQIRHIVTKNDQTIEDQDDRVIIIPNILFSNIE